MEWYKKYWPDIKPNEWVEAQVPKKVKKPDWAAKDTTPYVLITYQQPDKRGNLTHYWQRGRYNYTEGCWYAEASKNYNTRRINPVMMMIVENPHKTEEWM